MQRYVVLIANSEDQDSFEQLARRLARRFSKWRCALDGRRAKVWVKSTPPSPIGFTSCGRSGCLIGVEFGDRRPVPWDGAVGRGLLSRSWGAYVAVQVGEGPNVTITRDPSGQIPCWTSRLSGADVYFSHIDDMPEAEAASTNCIDWDYIQYHLNTYNRGRQTGLKAIAELLPGWQVRYAGGEGKESSAWPIADIIACPFESRAAAVAGVREATAAAVGSWARRYDRLLLNLSGGFDSAVVLGLIREQAPDTHVLAVNYLIKHPEGDERAYAHAAANHNGVPLRVEPMSTDGWPFELDKARRWLRPGNLQLGGPDVQAQVASTIGAHAAFTGIGGDQVFGQNLPPSVVAEAVQDHLPLPDLLTIVHDYAKMSSDTFWNISWVTVQELWGPKRALKALLQMPNPYLTRDGIEGVHFERFAHPDLLEVKERISTAKLDQLISFHTLNNCSCRDGPDITPDEVKPLQSQLVLEASLRTPSYWMNPAGRRRGLARRAFRDVIPDMILTRRGKGATTSQTLQILANNKSFLRELMLDGHLVGRRLLDKNKLEIALSSQSFATRASLPGLVPIITTELWVQSYLSHFAELGSNNKRRTLAASRD